MLEPYYFSRKSTPTDPPTGGGTATTETFTAAVLALTNLRVYYLLNEPSGTTMTDSGGSAVNGTYVGSPTLGVSGPTGTATAATFDGATAYGSATHNAVFGLGTSDFTFGFWLKDASWPAASSFLFCHDGSGETGTWEAYQTSTTNTLNGRIESTNVLSGVGTKNDGAWHLIGCSYDRDATAQWYLDGSTDGSATNISAHSGTNISASKTLYVARRNATAYASVSLAHLFLCATALSASDWATLWGAR